MSLIDGIRQRQTLKVETETDYDSIIGGIMLVVAVIIFVILANVY